MSISKIKVQNSSSPCCDIPQRLAASKAVDEADSRPAPHRPSLRLFNTDFPIDNTLTPDALPDTASLTLDLSGLQLTRPIRDFRVQSATSIYLPHHRPQQAAAYTNLKDDQEDLATLFSASGHETLCRSVNLFALIPYLSSPAIYLTIRPPCQQPPLKQYALSPSPLALLSSAISTLHDRFQSLKLTVHR